MDGKSFKGIREKSGATQESWATALNRRFGKKYDKSRVCRWESGSEAIPEELAGALLLDNMTADRQNSATIISVGIRKGGTGKSTISSALGYVLTRVKYSDRKPARILLVDADSQSNTTLACGISKEEILKIDAAGRSLYHVMTGKAKIDDCVIATSIPGMEIIPSAVSLAASERELLFREALKGIPANDALKDAISDEFRCKFDYIIFDLAPTLGVTTLCPLYASDYVLYAVQAESHAIAAMDHLTEIVETVRVTGNHELQVLGVVPNMVNIRLKQDRLSMEEMIAKAALIKRDLHSTGVPVFSPIPRCTGFAEASASNVLLYQCDVMSPGIKTFIEIAGAMGVQTLIQAE